MTEPTNQENGGEGTSPTSGKPAGTFGPTEKNTGKKVDGVNPPKSDQNPTTSLEKMRKLERFLVKIDFLIKDTEHVAAMAKTRLDKEGHNRIASMVSELGEFKNLVQKDTTRLEELEGDVDEIEVIINNVQKQLFESLDNNEIEALEEKNKNERLIIIFRQQTKYLKLLSNVETLRKSNISDTSLQEETLRIADELNWLTESEKTEEFSKNASLEALKEIEVSINNLTEKLNEALMLLEKEDAKRGQIEEEKKAQEKIQIKASDIIKIYSTLRDEADTLKVIDTAINSQRAAMEDAVAKAKGRFRNKPTNSTLDDLTKHISDYEAFLPELRNAAVVTVAPTGKISPPSFLSRGLSNQEDSTPAQGSTSAGVTKQSSERSADDIGIPNIRETTESIERNDGTKEYEILVNGKNILVPKVFLGTINRFKAALENQANTGVDFSRAIELKEEVLNAIEVADFNLADRRARALGKELTYLENEASRAAGTAEKQDTGTAADIVSKTRKTPEESFEDILDTRAERELKSKIKYFTNILPSTIRKKNDDWEIRRGTDFKKMNANEFAAWKPILHMLISYRKFVVTKFDAHSYSQLVSLKNEILGALEVFDFDTAAKKVDDLRKELDPMSDKDVVPETEKTAGRIREEIRNTNLKKYEQFKDAPIPDDETSFLFIKNIGSAETKSLKIINRNTGDWDELTREDLDAVELAQSALTNFRIRTTTPVGSVEKKNTILRHINHYQFADAKKAAEEYLTEFSALTRGAPSVPIQQVPKTPASIERNSAQQRFTHLQKVLHDTNTLFTLIQPYLRSDEEKKAFQKISNNLNGLETEILESPTQELVNHFKEKVESYVTQLKKKVMVLEALYGEQNIVPQPTVSPKNITVMRAKSLRGDGPKTETLEEFNVRQQQEKVVTTARESDARQEQYEELKKKHEEMLERNSDLYKHIYGGESSVRDETTEKISEQTPKEYLLSLTKKRDALEEEWKELMINISNKTAFGNPEGAAKVLRAQINLLDLQIAKYTKFSLKDQVRNHDDQIHRPEHSSFVTNKMVYSPTDEILPTPNIGRELLTDKVEIEALGKEQVNASTSTLAHHQSGLISTLTPQQAQKVENAIHIEPGAMDNTDLERYRLENSEEHVMGIEGKQERQTFVQKLAETLFKFPKVRINKWGWLAAGLTTAAVGGAAAYTVGTIEKNNRPKTIAELIKNQPSWRTFINENVPPEFVSDFSGPKALPFYELIKINAPSFSIGPNNPSAIDKFANLVCKYVYEVEGANAGLHEAQQKESARIIKNMEEIVKATKAPSGVVYDKDTHFFGDMNTRQFYEVVRKIAADADAEKARLSTI